MPPVLGPAPAPWSYPSSRRSRCRSRRCRCPSPWRLRAPPSRSWLNKLRGPGGRRDRHQGRFSRLETSQGKDSRTAGATPHLRQSSGGVYAAAFRGVMPERVRFDHGRGRTRLSVLVVARGGRLSRGLFRCRHAPRMRGESGERGAAARRSRRPWTARAPPPLWQRARISSPRRSWLNKPFGCAFAWAASRESPSLVRPARSALSAERISFISASRFSAAALGAGSGSIRRADLATRCSILEGGWWRRNCSRRRRGRLARRWGRTRFDRDLRHGRRRAHDRHGRLCVGPSDEVGDARGACRDQERSAELGAERAEEALGFGRFRREGGGADTCRTHLQKHRSPHAFRVVCGGGHRSRWPLGAERARSG